MTTTARDDIDAGSGHTGAAHPLDRLTPEEMAAAVAIIKDSEHFGPRMRFASLGLHPPDKADVLSFAPGDEWDRRADAILLDNADGAAVEMTVSLTTGTVTRHERLLGVQPAVILNEFFESEELIRNDPAFVEAMAKRDITDLSLVTIDPWSAGNYGDPVESDKRIIRALVWVRSEEGDNQYAHPVDGVMVIIDLNEMKVVRVDDEGVIPVPQTMNNYSSTYRTNTRTDIKTLEITQPDGASFTIDGDRIRWQKWDLRVGWTHREGLVLNTVTYTDGDRVRPVLYRASLAEMTVPYGDPSPTQARKNAFDVGEYGLGMLANSLVLGCDCLGEIHYLDGHFVDGDGDVITIPQAICIHEEDFGISWKHTDFRTEQAEVRRLRRLVVSFIATVGNYEYGLYWYLYQDGRVELDIKLTGILSTGALSNGTPPKYGTDLGDGLYGPNHQHFFCVRLDTQIDGVENSVVEVNTRPAPPEENPFGNAFYGEQTVLATEQEAQRLIDPLVGRYWKITSSDATNKTGAPTAYKLVPGENILPFATEESSIRQRAAYMWKHLWVTPYDPSENHPAGDYPNQHPGGAGLPEWTKANRSVTDTDIVVWYVMGHNHLPILEDWPVMPVANMGFTLKPAGFFDESPVMDLPPSSHCH
ncbi:MAG: primary-amine oxidase [Acidimicrobiales bacterium]